MKTHPHTHRPGHARPSLATRIATAFVAVMISSTVIGGVLGLFEMRSNAVTLAAGPALGAHGAG